MLDLWPQRELHFCCYISIIWRKCERWKRRRPLEAISATAGGIADITSPSYKDRVLYTRLLDVINICMIRICIDYRYTFIKLICIIHIFINDMGGAYKLCMGIIKNALKFQPELLKTLVGRPVRC